MPTPHIHDTPADVAAAFAKYLAQEIAASDQFHIALSGGSTPKLLFTHLAEKYIDEINWTKVHLYWGDERCVPITHEESNYRVCKELLIDKLPIPEDNIFRIRGEDHPPLEAEHYAHLLIENLHDIDGIPIFDMVLLGMGADGHTASIFPDRMELLTTDQLCAVAQHPETGQKRITITGRVINAAKQQHFLVTGASKQPVIKAVFDGGARSAEYPVSGVSGAEWWVDARAWGD